MAEPANKTLAIIVQAALCGARCPANDQLGPYGWKRLSQMAATGDVLIEVYPKNFRRVTILTGEHAGKRTAEPPPLRGGIPPKPYITISARGSFRSKRAADRPTRQAVAGAAEELSEMTPYHKLKPWQPPPFTPPNALPHVLHKIRGGRA